MPEIFHLEAYVSKQDFPDFGPRARPWAGPMGRAHGAGAGAGALLVKANSPGNLHPEKMTCPGPNLDQFW